MTRSRVHVRLYRLYLKLAPKGHRLRHGADQVELFTDLIDTGHLPWRLWAGAIPDLLAVTRATPRRLVMSHIARLALYPLSLVNILAGTTLAGIALTATSVPAWVAGPAVVITAQGLYTLLWLGSRLPLRRGSADLVFAMGETAALVAGATGVVAALISQAGTPDPEYGPPTMLTLVAIHGLVGLLAPDGRTLDTRTA